MPTDKLDLTPTEYRKLYENSWFVIKPEETITFTIAPNKYPAEHPTAERQLFNEIYDLLKRSGWMLLNLTRQDETNG